MGAKLTVHELKAEAMCVISVTVCAREWLFVSGVVGSWHVENAEGNLVQ